MIYNLYSVYDVKADYFLAPNAALNDAVAQREFYRLLKIIPSMSEHPNDFILYYCGTFDPASCDLDMSPKLRLVVHGLSCIESIEQEFENHETAQSQESTSTPV